MLIAVVGLLIHKADWAASSWIAETANGAGKAMDKARLSRSSPLSSRNSPLGFPAGIAGTTSFTPSENPQEPSTIISTCCLSASDLSNAFHHAVGFESGIDCGAL